MILERICRELVHTLAIAERMGIMHRDIEPKNILINEEGNPVVIDFGLSNAVDDGDVKPGGTGFFNAPELFMGAEIIPQSEVFSIGRTLLSVVKKMPESDVKQTLKQILDKASRGPVSDRYESVTALYEELKKLVPENLY